MCLAKAYKGEELIAENIAEMREEGDVLKLKTLFGEEVEVEGKVLSIDFVKSRIIIGGEVEGSYKRMG